MRASVVEHLCGFLVRNRLRIPLVTGTVALVAAATVYQGQIEAGAAEQFHQVQSVLASQIAHAREVGLHGEELAPYLAAERAASSRVPPLAWLFFNNQRIGFFEQNSRTASQQVTDLRELELAITGRTREEATVAVSRLRDHFARGGEIGADPEDLAPLQPAVKDLQTALEQSVWPKDYRPLKARADEATVKVDAVLRAQEADNARIAELTAEAAAENHGDLELARRNAAAALDDARFDLQMADLMKLSVGRLPWRVDQATEMLRRAQTLAEVEAVTAALRLRDSRVMEVLAAGAPEKAITISLTEQRLRAFEHGKLLWSAAVTTGRPGLETDTGTWKVLRKDSPWTMHSPWPKELPDGKQNPWWYPDTPVRWVMWFTNTGEGIHDADWRSVFGRGTNFPHDDPVAPNGTHGCVNLPKERMAWLWNWTPAGTPVIVY